MKSICFNYVFFSFNVKKCLQARKLKNLARDLDEKLLTETFDDHAEEDDDSSEGDSDSGDGRNVVENGADCAPASRVVSRCDSRDSLTSAHSDMVLLKQTGFQHQRGGSLDRVQVNLY
jgi:hypothetical protein